MGGMTPLHLRATCALSPGTAARSTAQVRWMVGFGLIDRATEVSYVSLMATDTLSASLAPIELIDPDGQAVRLGTLWEEGPTVLVFLRHYG